MAGSNRRGLANDSRSLCFGFRGKIRPSPAGHVTLRPIPAGSGVPDIFLSYNREDQARAKLFADAFRTQGFEVWQDLSLKPGEAYDEVMETALRAVKDVAVLRSRTSVVSRWVRAEATLAHEAVRKARKAKPNDGLDFRLGFARGSYMSEVLLRSFSQIISDAWNTTARDSRT
jgi:hypothetical protein